jgi:site-specific recombinase XerD
MHLLEDGVNLIYIRDLLGHTSITTTEIYAKANPEVKRAAIEKASSHIIPTTHFTPQARDDLLDYLTTLI